MNDRNETARHASIGKRIWRIALTACMVLFLQPCPNAGAQQLKDKWLTLSPAEFEKFRHVFVPYGIETYGHDIVVLSWGTLRMFRIEAGEFCARSLCLTLIVVECGKASCPSATVFAKREVDLDSAIAGYFGGTQFLRFPLSQDKQRDIVVMITKNFISAWRGFGEN